MIRLAGLAMGVIVMSSLSLAPGPRNGLIMASSRRSVEGGRGVLLGYAAADLVFCALAFLAEATMAHWRALLPAAVCISVSLYLALIVVDLRALRAPTPEPRGVPDAGSFRSGLRASLRNAGLAFDAAFPIGTAAALLDGDPRLSEGLIVGTLLGSVGWMALLCRVARSPGGTDAMARAWPRLLVIKIALCAVQAAALSLTL